MNPDTLKPKEENLFSLATEMGLVVLAQKPPTEERYAPVEETTPKQKPFSQLT